MKLLKKQRGFTLVEVLTSVSVFLIVITISMGSILGVFTANKKSRTLKTVMNNLNLTVDTLSREMRFGKNYHCGQSGQDTNPLDCPDGNPNRTPYISFLSQDGRQITYKLNGSSIEKSVNGITFIPITGPEINIQTLKFYVIGAPSGDGLQPKVIIVVQGYADIGGKAKTDFSLETLVSQRQLDL